MPKERMNVTLDAVTTALLADHKKFNQPSMSALIEVAVSMYCDRQTSLSNTTDIQKLKDEVRAELRPELIEEMRNLIYNEVRSVLAEQSDAEQELSEEDKALVDSELSS